MALHALAVAAICSSVLQLHDSSGNGVIEFEASATSTISGDVHGINASLPLTCQDFVLASTSDDPAKSSLAGLVSVIEAALATLDPVSNSSDAPKEVGSGSGEVGSGSGELGSGVDDAAPPSTILDKLSQLVAKAKEADRVKAEVDALQDRLARLEAIILPVTTPGGIKFESYVTNYATHDGEGSGSAAVTPTAVGTGVFSDGSSCLVPGLASVTLAPSIVSIGSNAFKDCPLTSVTIPDSVTSIGSSAFDNTQLTSVTIPNSVTSIGERAFDNTPLTSVTIGNSVTSIGSYAFSSSSCSHVPCPSSFLTSVTIGSSVTSIGSYAFYNTPLTSVTIPNSVTSIGSYAFYNTQLTSVTIGNSVASIGSSAFRNTQLTSVTIPNSVTSIAYYAFSNTPLTAITLPSGLTCSTFWGISDCSIATYV